MGIIYLILFLIVIYLLYRILDVLEQK
ncbi:putative [Helicobacter pylori J99]|uniref:Uncharacterized protein HP_0560 n=3 Tax=Helicobacter pylori TaxID=210 RepID=Y560_HELPY|nr:RecName: Full=Uncharacterized protein HP_0560 [Helicobacter pylori 26695]P64662.1 RecName: Full=Uncharacterized protein jhp_0507 [Helicobacter pylori J99]ABF84606.1 hypothetical protein HPAG1_0539 [Helicobacter pylori HPAG1]ACX97963.1 hypothetical protein KHP_0758 [Helicobacter pylori 51]EQL67230.1 hypothetical protein N408_03235 [Helicobacter pylori FD703]EQL70627.1 hypothetical protein N407_02965 [Helicobacter pylori FD662]AAD06083.1 putative [Helicobacter pylori J99]